MAVLYIKEGGTTKVKLNVKGRINRGRPSRKSRLRWDKRTTIKGKGEGGKRSTDPRTALKKILGWGQGERRRSVEGGNYHHMSAGGGDSGKKHERGRNQADCPQEGGEPPGLELI